MNFRRKLKQWAVYWPPLDLTKQGQETFGVPVEIRVRWEDNMMEAVDAAGQKWMSKAQVYHTYATKENGYIWLGKFQDLVDRDVPTANPDAARLVQFDSIPSRTADQSLRCAYL